MEQLLPEAKGRIKRKAMLDDMYRELCKKVRVGGNIDMNFAIKDELPCWKNRIYAPEGMRQRIIQSEHDSKVAEHFGKDRTLELVTRNFFWTNMERKIRKYCNK